MTVEFQEGSAVCPECGLGKGEVRDSRPWNGFTRRRRHCLSCDHKWSTVEVPLAFIKDLPGFDTQIRIARGLLQEILDKLTVSGLNQPHD
jgi:hypothetical protein